MSKGTLRKTATVIHNFEELDQMMSANDAVVDWLQCKELVRNGCDNEINGKLMNRLSKSGGGKP